MMQGITSLPGAQQGPQGPMPGQSAPAQVMPQQQGGIAPPITAPLEKLPPQQLLMMYNNPQDMTPKWAVATAYAKAIEQARLMQMAQGQSAMAQGMAQAQEPPVVQQIMSQPMPGAEQAYAGGGAVSFADGESVLDRLPGETDDEYEARRAAYSRGNLGGASPIPYYLPPPSAERDRLNRLPFEWASSLGDAIGRGWEKFTEGSTIETQRNQRKAEEEKAKELKRLAELNRARFATPRPSMSEEERAAAYEKAGLAALPPSAARRAPGASPGAGVAALVANATGAKPSQAAAPAPASSFMTALEALRKREEEAARKAGELSPELIQARKNEAEARAAGFSTREGIERRRMADVAEQEERIKQQRGLRGLQNAPLMAAVASGAVGKRFADVLSGAVGGGYKETVRQEGVMQGMEDKLRAARAGVDDVTLAKMEYDAATKTLQVAQLTGDRDKMAAAQVKFLEAQRHLLDVQQREVASQRQADTALKAAQISAAAKEGAQSFAERRFSLQMLKQDPAYQGAINKIKSLSKAAGATNSPTIQAQYRAAVKEATDRAREFGLGPEVVGQEVGAGTGAAGAPAGRVIDFSSIK